MFKGIKGRWIRNYVAIPALIIIVLQVVSMFLIHNYYYNLVENNLSNRVMVASTFYNEYTSTEFIDFEKSINKFLEQGLDLTNHVEVQIVDLDGDILFSSTGMNGKEAMTTSDIIRSKEGLRGKYVGAYHENSSVMAISMPLYFRDEVAGIMRCITSLNKVQDKIIEYFIAILLFGLFLISIMVLMSNVFSRSIIDPINEISRISQQYANNDFSNRLSQNYKDEIGELTNSINYMADEISKVQELKNDFIASISHELRTPLTAIKGWTQTMLIGDLSKTNEVEQGLYIIEQETERLRGLVEELLDFSRIEAKQLKLEVESLDIVGLVEEVRTLFAKKCMMQDIDLIAAYDAEEIIIDGDVNRIKQVLINIMDNAVKFTAIVDTKKCINIHVTLKEDVVKIDIKDSGIGIVQAEQHKVKEKFYKGQHNLPGSGLGLAICEEIIKLHGGELQVHSNTEGTTISFYLKKTIKNCQISVR